MTITITAFSVGIAVTLIFLISLVVHSHAEQDGRRFLSNATALVSFLSGLSLPIFLLAGIVNTLNEGHNQRFPGQWNILYHFIEGETGSTEDKGMRDFKTQFNCPEPLPQAGFTKLLNLTNTENRDLLNELFTECIAEPNLPWNDTAKENEEDDA